MNSKRSRNVGELFLDAWNPGKASEDHGENFQKGPHLGPLNRSGGGGGGGPGETNLPPLNFGGALPTRRHARIHSETQGDWRHGGAA